MGPKGAQRSSWLTVITPTSCWVLTRVPGAQLSPHNRSGSSVQWLPYYKWGSGSTERFSNSSEVTQLGNSGAWVPNYTVKAVTLTTALHSHITHYTDARLPSPSLFPLFSLPLLSPPSLPPSPFSEKLSWDTLCPINSFELNSIPVWSNKCLVH